ncbi:nitroreductase family protein [Limosilactobacillus equigenerosi]|uniref:Nitroreductase n=1 Tax=Limosilactobacillus equigenerosi DSM 18793 = JCM 14505 TaxID=1423742 RepID=A0A0R1UFY9_9LACO|nr:nitroreductase family protein [Limosilactobacillus equigenerosi]KRL92253.1 nitroreductase [Limosilactobacillus equigenerosi DSM 18793 = JCM 14505]
MEIDDLMQQRHTVRKYQNRLISANIKEKISTQLNKLSMDYQINTEIRDDGKNALHGLMAKLMSDNVKNVIVFKGDNYHVGYVAAKLMLFIQQLGLNTWFVAGSINREKLGEETVGILVFGYGKTDGKAHKLKRVVQVSDYQSNKFPAWYLEGIKGCLLAPTAFNKQLFKLSYNNGNIKLQVKNSSYAKVEAGILSYFFEQGSGRKITEYELV